MIEDMIKNTLKRQPMTIEEVANSLNISRATASKYLMVLETRGDISKREVGRAKLYFVKRLVF